MMIRKLIMASAGVVILAACSQAVTESEAAPAMEEATMPSTAPMEMADEPILAGISTGVYNVDPTHGYITFSYDHQGYSRPYLRFRKFSATLNLNAENPANSSVSVVIDAKSIDSGVDVFDGHLNSPDFFDTETFPQITFVSTGLEITGKSSGKMTGNLTAKGITKPLTLDVTFNKADFSARDKKYKIGFSAQGKILRSDWDLGRYVPYVGDEIELIIETEFLSEAEGE